MLVLLTHKSARTQKKKKCHFVDCLEESSGSCFDPDIAAVAAAVMAAAAAPNLTPPAAFMAPAIFANAATPPTSRALRATVGFIVISYKIEPKPQKEELDHTSFRSQQSL
ncbi:hypothetical protein ACSBR2_043004 [Camellia fascicularis]